MELWLREQHTEGYSVSWKIKEIFYQKQTPYQHLAIVEFYDLGRALVLDGIVQTTEKDEYIYHEMIAHVPMFSLRQVETVLVIGGGDGGTVREVLKHTGVKKVVLAEIDEDVINACRQYLPVTAACLSDPRVELAIGDGIKYVEQQQAAFDLIIVDSSDPIGPAEPLFGSKFYQLVKRALKPGGAVVAQTESPLFYPQAFQRAVQAMRENFTYVKPYLTAIPSYVGGFWTFTMASDSELKPSWPETLPFSNRYYTPEVHQAAFALPPFVAEIVNK
ncbi:MULTISPECIES: polyamine aminopropyltransferase [Carboxydocella]|uniref:Polyamine aminopropyltransferase n=2 Tax=Carboxydocella TaxID=178898 RepID=A0A1T4QSE2_9FIRM|nr:MULTISPECIES: polyamine aminopropyltransferase [Carboxydocella]AVX20822.1 spermidine synthase [Carboxydocella thermautotrophica]GAW30008.1 polyamine aminopropyltransferase 1 [Carboxydocella sp. ULO1]GAW32081.1 polyamine aminopropyltransferase 1 [Carboxydocella sp. JDF658]SKA06604.1 spermidine synthase [Carboxydocella sporoproducens DSM 16521]